MGRKKSCLKIYSKFLIFRGIFSDFYTKKIEHLGSFVQFYKLIDTTNLIVNLL